MQKERGKGGGTRLGACSDSTLPPSTQAQMNSRVHTLVNTQLLTSTHTHTADGYVKDYHEILNTEEIQKLIW